MSRNTETTILALVAPSGLKGLRAFDAGPYMRDPSIVGYILGAPDSWKLVLGYVYGSWRQSIRS